jgi:hypothetical protein
VFEAGFDDFAGQSLGDFDSFGHAAALGDEARNVWTGSDEAAFFQGFDAHANGDFFNFGEMLFAFH